MKKTFKTLVFATLGLLALASCEDVPAPYQLPSNNQGEEGGGEDTETLIGDGTYASPFNVAAANKVTGELTQSNTSETHLSEEVYVKGIVSQIESIDTGQYGNATYYISDDGSTTNQLEVYRGYGFDGAKFKSESDLAVGDTLIVCGKLQNWLGKAYEFTTGSKIVYRNGKTTGEPTPGPTPSGNAQGDGTAASPFNVAGINQFIDSGNYAGKEVYFEGIITKFKNGEEPGNSYGNATFYISDDGKTGGEDFYVFRTYGFNGEKFTSKNQLKVGDKVVIRSTVTLYQGKTKETEANKGVLISVNGKQEYSGGSQTPDGGAGTAEKPYTVAQALEIINAGTYTKDKVYVSGIVSKIDEISAQYGNATYYISDNGKTDNQLEVFRGYGLGGEKFQSEDDLMVGDKVIVLGALTLYNNTPEITTGSQLYSINGETAGGGSQGGGSTEGNSITFSEKGYENAQDFDGKSITLGDATLSWSVGSGSTTPKYYNTGSAMRLYGGNTLTISSQKTIASVEFTYGEDYNGTSYTPTQSDASITPDGYDFSTHKWSGSAQSIVLSRTATTGHFRIVGIKITYAQ